MTRGILILLLALGVWTLPAVAQEPEGAAPQAATQADQKEPEAAEDLEAIERMLLEDEEVLEGSGFTYDPQDRRDPFQSLLSVVEEPELLGPRPDGVPGLLIDEVAVTGVFVTAKGPVAQVQSADKTRSFLLRKGDRLYDGDVLDIRYKKNEIAEIVFRQDVRDAAAAKPFREVVKRLESP